jgi:hypothetical protein
LDLVVYNTISDRLVRFDNFLSRVPYKQSLGFGGEAGSCPTHQDYDRGLVQKIILVMLKCVALTTREARWAQRTYCRDL